VHKVGLLDVTQGTKRDADPRVAWLRELVAGAEALAVDLAENPAGRDYSLGAAALVRRAQALADDVVEQAVVDGWLTRLDADALLRRQRMGATDAVSATAVRAKPPR
jgi:hypothetical protein